MNYICVVCGYPYLDEPPYDKFGYGTYLICPCCGFEFGLDDDPNKEECIKTWRNNWINNGFQWFSKRTAPPVNWNPKKQLSCLKK